MNYRKAIINQFLLAVILLACSSPGYCRAEEHVVLLHGLARTSKSMTKMKKALEKDGYKVWNYQYPSRTKTIEKICAELQPVIVSNTVSADRVHFVTHSMGGILMRYMQSNQPFTNLGRVVMLSPPNQGSEVVDKLGDLNTFKWINGPAGDQLGTGSTNLLATLPPVDFELGILTGDRSINWILSMLIPGSDDGKVSIERAKCPGMKEFAVIHATHPYMMKNRKSIAMTRNFLRSGSFKDKTEDRRQ